MQTRIAVIADTHNRLPHGVVSEIATADEIWHLGDICNEDTLATLRALPPPLLAIRGNCDPRGLSLPESLVLHRGRHTFYLIHEPPSAIPSGAGFALHGHTHVQRDETIGGTRHLNPGSVGKANHGAPPSYAWLTLDDDLPPRWDFVRLD